MNPVESNKAFGIYVAALVGGILSVLSASIMAGVTTLPSFLVLVEHVAMSVGFRAAYKSLDGPYGVLDQLRERFAARAVETATGTGRVAGAAS